MKQAVAYLTPYIEEEKLRAGGDGAPSSKGKILMATVKGDVHDIGKNIVGVVLGCNNYDIIDMGVMVPAEKILQTARAEKVDMIGLSGLITPSLDEMVNVAKEMERQGFKIPLLIGGATTSKTHTAVKIAPQYSQPVIHVLDASKSVPTASTLLGEDKWAFAETIAKDYERIRIQREGKKSTKTFLPIEKARENKAKIDWANYTPPQPKFTGTKVFDNYDLAELAHYIDWTPFFASWQLFGKYPAIFDDKIVGIEAKKLFDDAQAMLKTLIAEKWLSARGVIGFWYANSKEDDLILKNESYRNAFDVALWDLKARRAGLSLAKLLGAHRESVQCYNTSGGFLHTPLDQLLVNASASRERGIGGIKLKVGQPDHTLDLRRVEAMRKHLGDVAPLMVDANQQWDRPTAQRMCRSFEQFNLVWIEEPLDAYDHEGHAALAAQFDTPIATGEMLTSAAEHADLIRHRAADYLMPDAPRLGGITPFLKVAALADHAGLMLAPHFAMELHVHLAAAYPREPWVEHFDWLEPLFNERLDIRAGRMLVPTRPGLGLSLSQQARAWTRERAEFGTAP